MIQEFSIPQVAGLVFAAIALLIWGVIIIHTPKA
jgi:hypothetical protein